LHLYTSILNKTWSGAYPGNCNGGLSWGEPGDLFAFFNKNKQFIGHISKN